MTGASSTASWSEPGRDRGAVDRVPAMADRPDTDDGPEVVDDLAIEVPAP
ncbi:MAG: hypothetical protein ACTHN0_12715 [Aquihabitans sp.]